MPNTDSDYLYHSLLKLYRQIFRLSHIRMHGKHKIYRGQAGLLLIISKNNGASQRELAEQLDIRPSSMTEMLLKMEAAGMINRIQDEKDRRVMRIFLTEKGKIAADSMTGTADDFFSSIFNTLTEEEKEQMSTITKKLCSNIEAMNPQDEVIYHEGFDLHHSHHHHNHVSRKEHKHHGNGYNPMPPYLL